MLALLLLCHSQKFTSGLANDSSKPENQADRSTGFRTVFTSVTLQYGKDFTLAAFPLIASCRLDRDFAPNTNVTLFGYMEADRER